MSKTMRRVKWGIKQKFTKNVLIIAISVCCVIAAFVNYYVDCSTFKTLVLLREPDKCKGETEVIKLNVTLLAESYPSHSAVARHAKSKITRSNAKNRGMLILVTAAAAEIESGSSKQATILPDTGNDETDTDFPLEMVFDERKQLAQQTCKDMLNVALAKENDGVELNAEENDSLAQVEFSVGRPGKRLPNKPIYNQDMLQIMKLHNKPKYFKSTIGVKKNRWIHFHRIIESPISPKENKVVDITWCPVFKAASTPWLAVFTKLSKGLTNKTEAQIKRGKLGFMELARMFRLLTPRIYEKNVRVAKYAMVVARHPFKRLLSAYRDKIERVKGRLFYYKKYSVKILSKYRQRGNVIPKKYKDPDHSVKVSVPTFEEFVRFVLSSDPRKLDEHWRPMYLDCNPCYRNFDFILKVETLNDDKEKVLQYLHLSPSDPQYKEVEDVWTRWNNPSGNGGQNRTESFYYSQLTTENIHKLYELYEPDFQIFDYSPDAYFAMANINHTNMEQ